MIPINEHLLNGNEAKYLAEDWDQVLLPEIERQQELGKEVVFRADAAFAKPEIYEALEERGVKYAIRLPANDNLLRDIEELLTRRWGGPVTNPSCGTKAFSIRPPVGRELFPRLGFIVTNPTALRSSFVGELLHV